MRYSNTSRTVTLAIIFLLFLLLARSAAADMAVLTADSITATQGITNPAGAYGTFNGTVAYTTNTFAATGDTVTMTMSNYSAVGTIISVQFTIRMNTSGAWNNDVLAIQYSNDSGTTWFSAATNLRPPATLTTYGNYTITASYPSAASLNNTLVRLQYTRSGPADGIRSGIDGVEMYITYAPPPTVSLTSPNNDTFVTTSSVPFNFTPSSLTTFNSCSLYINSTPNASNQTPVTSNANNTITSTLADGTYLWNVTCTDSGGYSGTSSAARTVKVDTTPPAVTLLSPPDNHISSTTFNTFNFSVNDAAPVTSCILVIDGVERNSYDNPSRGMTLSTNATMTIGDHLWYINCTDANGFVGQSQTRNHSVQVTTPTIVTDAGEYELGETVVLSGSNWQAGANISVNTTLPNGTVMVQYATANGSGKINATFYLNYSFPSGTYKVNVSQVNDSSYNTSGQYVVNARLVNITADLASYTQGDTVVITGLGFAPLSTVNLTIKYFGGANQTNLSANSTGGFSYSYALLLNEPLGQHNVTAVDRNFSNIAANTTFAVTQRIPTVSTNKTSYVVNETVGITGLRFTPLSSITLEIINTLTGRLGTDFPATASANSTGGFSYSWYSNNTCSGNYTILAEDTNSLHANTTFLINNTFSQQVQAVPTSVSGNRVTPTLSLVNTSNEQRQPAGVTSTNQWGYLQFAFRPGIPPKTQSLVATFVVEHARTVGNRNINYQVYWVNASGAYAVSGCGPTSITSAANVDSIATCDLSAYVTNATYANNATIRVNYTTTQTVDAQVDFAYINLSWTGDPVGCKEFGSTPAVPTVSNIITPAGAVVLNAGTTKRVECNFTVTDANGANEIIGANATIYISPSTSSSGATNVSKYDNTSCEVVGSDAVSKDFSCAVDLLYYASNGTWTCNATGISTDGIDSATDTFSVDPLYAINISDTLLSFGNLTTSAISANISENITNIGNQRINITTYGYGSIVDDGNAFNCPVQNISIGYVRFAANSSATYAQKAQLSSVPRQVNLTINAQATPAVLRTNATYWQIQIPDTFNDTGECNGTIVFQAELG